MIIRVRSSTGTERVEIDENATLSTLKSKILTVFPNLTQFILSKTPDNNSLLNGDTNTLKSLQLKHGDMLYLKSTGKEEAVTTTTTTTAPEIVEDPIDTYLETQDGWIQRERDPQLCHHNANGKCTWCMPLAPWSILEIEPWKSEGIKYIPFHSYIRKLQANSGCKHPETQRCLNCKSIDQPNYKIKPGCTRHPAWPEGICSDCDPGTVIINSQSYRHVDHVEFESMQVVDSFIQGWRETGRQRFGFLYGKYVADKSIPLGIRAVVFSIYEPPQKSTVEGSVPEKDKNQDKVDQLAQLLGLTKIGMIWSDLQVDPKTKKMVKSRGEIPLKSEEIIRMSKLQNKNPSPSKQTLSGKCGSKFVSVLVTGNSFGEVELQVYQVSDQCMSLTSAGIITFSKDPNLLRTKKTSKRYIPELLYRKIDEYKNNVIVKAEPTFPPEFFIIAIRHSAPKDPKPYFKSHRFPVENRDTSPAVPSSTSMSLIKTQFDKMSFIDAIADFHLLVNLYLNVSADQSFDPKLFEKLGNYIERRENEPQVKAFITSLLKNVSSSSSSSSSSSTPQSTTQTKPPSTSGSSSSSSSSSSMPPKTPSPSVNPKEKELINQLVSMGYSETQAREAVWATGSAGIEQAMNFILN